jgi:hypothetical protein
LGFLAIEVGQCSAVQCSALQCSAVQCSVQCSVLAIEAGRGKPLAVMGPLSDRARSTDYEVRPAGGWERLGTQARDQTRDQRPD